MNPKNYESKLFRISDLPSLSDDLVMVNLNSDLHVRKQDKKRRRKKKKKKIGYMIQYIKGTLLPDNTNCRIS